MMRILSLITLALALLMLVGCEGETKYDISTGGDGSLEGLVITPTPQSLSVDTNEDFYLDWKRGYEPPSTIHFWLQSINSDGVREDIRTVRGPESLGHYIFRPATSLPSRTFLLLTVTGDGETARSMYLTTSGNGLFNKDPLPGGSVEHTINTRTTGSATP